MKTITLTRPDDWHCHLRDDIYLHRTVADTARQFQRAIVMPNLIPPITTVAHAQAYRERIQKHIPAGNPFSPLLTLYLTDHTNPSEIEALAKTDFIKACKLYPQGSTTHSHAGVSDLKNLNAVFAKMEELQIPLLMHGEVTDPTVDIFDREAIFIETKLQPLMRQFPQLRMVLEHISTRHAVDFIKSTPANIGATITAHHLLLNRNDLLVNGVHPHYYCLPILKSAQDQVALQQAAISGNPKFFLGTDSAPHAQHKKESACGCAGIYSAHAAIELYAEIFDRLHALDRLNNFASRFGAEFYRLPINTETFELIHQPWQVPNELAFGSEKLIPLFATQTLNWRIRSHDN